MALITGDTDLALVRSMASSVLAHRAETFARHSLRRRLKTFQLLTLQICSA
ncbi:MAG TPA: hypothetical protein VMV33_13725 [Rhodocyclaceae bacterium]|nr:hypothetical protein [Rhodocyclaceae bacterium]